MRDGGKDCNVVFHCSLRAQGAAPALVDPVQPFVQGRPRAPCDVPLGDHPAQYGWEWDERLRMGANCNLKPHHGSDVPRHAGRAAAVGQDAIGAAL
jgi:hypothetical protein